MSPDLEGWLTGSQGVDSRVHELSLLRWGKLLPELSQNVLQLLHR